MERPESQDFDVVLLQVTMWEMTGILNLDGGWGTGQDQV